jgi:hypothetical protein
MTKEWAVPGEGMTSSNAKAGWLKSALPRVGAVALLVSMSLLGWSGWRTYEHAAGAYQSARVTSAIADSNLWGTAFRGEALGFLVAQLSLHIGLAVFIGAGATVGMVAFPALRRRPLVAAVAIGAGCVLWVLMANAQLYPLSRWVASVRWLDMTTGLGIGAYHVLTVAMGLTLATAVGIAVARSGRRRGVWVRVLTYPAVLALAVWLWGVRSLGAEEPGASAQPPHVIVIGVDSLRPDVVGIGSRIALTPNLDRFSSEAVVFADTTTPLARTFPAWISVLTGNHPVRTGARENLFDPARLTLPATVGDLLRQNGYRTVYATDEVRFSNIDERYGFDSIIGPRMGASDFLIASVGDLPLSNLVSNTWVGRSLFPNLYINRAASVTYRPDTFVHELDERLDFSSPTFVAIHLALPHWPYHWAGSEGGIFEDTSDHTYAYSAAVVEADRQFGMLMRMLESKGALRNAIVVVLSDHGEALGLPKDNLIYSKDAKKVAAGVTVNMLGHGNSVLSPSQYEVFLAFREFGNDSMAQSAAGRVVSLPATLEDITPTVLELAGITDEEKRDGISFAQVVRGSEQSRPGTDSRYRFTETGITVGFTKEGSVELDRLVEENIDYYRVNAVDSRIQLGAQYVPVLMKAKERAAIGSEWLLAAVPLATEGMRTRYIAVTRDGRRVIAFDSADEIKEEPALPGLWDALHERYGAELRATTDKNERTGP